MRILKTILVAVKPTESSRQTLVKVTRLARNCGSEVVLIHVVESQLSNPLGDAGRDTRFATWLADLRQALELSGVLVRDVRCVHGKAAAEIIVAADELDANLIAISARSNSRSNHTALGPKAMNVMRKSGKPVLAVHPGQPLDLANILCPVDFSDVSARALNDAIRIARAFNAKLLVLTVMPPFPILRLHDPRELRWIPAAERVAVKRRANELGEFLKRFDLCNVEWTKDVARGDPAQEIIAVAKTTGTDLIVMGSIGRTPLVQRFMGSTALAVAKKMPCSLLTVKQESVVRPELGPPIADIEKSISQREEAT